MLPTMPQPVNYRIKGRSTRSESSFTHLNKVVCSLHEPTASHTHFNKHHIHRTIWRVPLRLHITEKCESIGESPRLTERLDNRCIQAGEWPVAILKSCIEQPKCLINSASLGHSWYHHLVGGDVRAQAAAGCIGEKRHGEFHISRAAKRLGERVECGHIGEDALLGHPEREGLGLLEATGADEAVDEEIPPAHRRVEPALRHVVEERLRLPELPRGAPGVDEGAEGGAVGGHALARHAAEQLVRAGEAAVGAERVEEGVVDLGGLRAAESREAVEHLDGLVGEAGLAVGGDDGGEGGGGKREAEGAHVGGEGPEVGEEAGSGEREEQRVEVVGGGGEGGLGAEPGEEARGVERLRGGGGADDAEREVRRERGREAEAVEGALQVEVAAHDGGEVVHRREVGVLGGRVLRLRGIGQRGQAAYADAGAGADAKSDAAQQRGGGGGRRHGSKWAAAV